MLNVDTGVIHAIEKRQEGEEITSPQNANIFCV